MSLRKNNGNINDTGHNVEALGSWDHGVEPYDVGNRPEDTDHKIENVQELVQGTQGIISRGRQFFREKFHDFREWVNNDRFREDYKSHSEEVVAGEKMAVKRMVHDKSFEAPC